MQEFIEKLIGRLEASVALPKMERMETRVGKKQTQGFCLGVRSSVGIVNQIAEEYSHCTLCYLQIPCEYQNENVKMPAEHWNGGWIPCSERLPEYTDDYNVTVVVASELGSYEKVTTLRFEKIKGREPKWIIPQNEVSIVLAWQPLPAPYQPKGE